MRPNYSSYDEEVEFIMEQFAAQYRQTAPVFERKTSLRRNSLLDVGDRVRLVSVSWQSESSSFEDDDDDEEQNGVEVDAAAEVLQLTFILEDVLAYANTLIIYKPSGFTLPPTCFCDANSGVAFAEMCMSINKQALQRKWGLIQLVGCVCSRLKKLGEVENMFTLTSSSALYRSIRQQLLAKRPEELLGDDVLLCALLFSAQHGRRHGVCNPRPSFFLGREQYCFDELAETLQQLPRLQDLCESELCTLESTKLLQWFTCLHVGLSFQSRQPDSLVFYIKESNVRHFLRPITAYHGTSLENVWSILQNGLQHTSIKKNGEAFGKGIYFSTKVNVAKVFARSTNKHGAQFLRHNSMIPAFLRQEKGGQSPSDYYCVLECQVDITSQANVTLDGTYIIVKNPSVVKLVKLHLGFQTRQQQGSARIAGYCKWISFFVAILAVACGIFLSFRNVSLS